MIPDRRWFPSSLQERGAWFANFNTQMQAIGASLGASPAELTHVDDDSSIVVFLANTAESNVIVSVVVGEVFASRTASRRLR